jgi:hypothetical protein
MDKGIPQVWRLWESRSQLQNMADPKFRERLVREFEGAARYLETLPAILAQNKPAVAPAPESHTGKVKSAGG